MDFEYFEKRICAALGYSVKSGDAMTSNGIKPYRSYIKNDRNNNIQLRITLDRYETFGIMFDAEIFASDTDRLFLLSIQSDGMIYLQENLTDGDIIYHCDGVKRFSTIERKLKQLIG